MNDCLWKQRTHYRQKMGVSVLRLFISGNEGSIYHFTTDRSKAVVAVLFDLCVFLWLLPAGLFNRLLSCLLPYWCVKWILSNSVIILLGKKQQATLFSLPCGTCTVWQDLSRAVIGTLYSMIIAITRHLLYCLFANIDDQYTGILYMFITKTRLFKYTENFTTKKEKFSDQKF